MVSFNSVKNSFCNYNPAICEWKNNNPQIHDIPASTSRMMVGVFTIGAIVLLNYAYQSYQNRGLEDRKWKIYMGCTYGLACIGFALMNLNIYLCCPTPPPAVPLNDLSGRIYKL